MSLIIDHVIHVELKYQFEFMVSCKLILKKMRLLFLIFKIKRLIIKKKLRLKTLFMFII